MDEKIKKILFEEGVIIFPTETVYAVGCLLTENGVERLYKIKNRPSSQPTLAIFPSLEKVKEYVEFDQEAEKLTQRFWPGALSLILKTKRALPKKILGKGNTLAVRISSHPWLSNFLKELKEPILAPSANFRGKPAPRTYSEIDKRLANLVDYVVEVSPSGSNPSTIVDLVERPFKIVRKGDISEEQINEALRN